ncbi:hypothetical protein SNARM312S_01015 [Streptomyces narbonensis]
MGGRGGDADAGFAGAGDPAGDRGVVPGAAEGLLGRDGNAGALLITPTNSVHTFGMRFAIDVAYLDRSLRVLSVVTMRPGRLGMVRPRGRHVLEAEAGAMAEWGLRPGTSVRITADPSRGR